MGIFNWLNKNKKAPEEEVTPGGSNVYRYATPEQHGWRPPETCGVYREEIAAHFERLFPDREGSVFHELISDLVHIDVNILKADETHDFQVLFTTGMSDLPMTMPEEIADREDLKYAELFLFLPRDWDLGQLGTTPADIPDEQFWPIRMLKFFARFPHEYKTWLGWGHTIPNGAQYSPLCEASSMGGVVLTGLGRDISGMDTADGKHINFYLLVPAYQEEIEFKLAHGMEALDERFREGNLPVVLDVHRPNYCADFTEILDGPSH